MVFQKFIIESLPDEGGDSIILAKCTYHKQLATNVDNVKGGGLWSLNREEETFTLFGDSFELGRAKFEDLDTAVREKRVFSSPACVINLTDRFKFKYKLECGEIIPLGILKESV